MSLLLAAIGSLVLSSQEKVHERVEVVYQEILARVFKGDRLVPGLKAEDFALFEDGKSMAIAHCQELRRSLASPEVPVGAAAAPSARGRLFVFLLWLDEESREWPKAWEHFLCHVYRAGDRVVLSDGTRTIEVSSPEKDGEKIKAFFAAMAEGQRHRKAEKNRLVKELEALAAKIYDDLGFNPFGEKAQHPSTDGTGPLPPGLKADLEKDYMDQFTQHFKAVINEYRLVRLKGYRSWLDGLAGALKAVEAEKWALVFMQNERLPLINRDGRLFRETPMMQNTANELRRMMDEIERQVQLDNDMTGYVRDLRSQFVGANATFHLFLCDAAKESLANEHLQWQPVFSSWESAFRQISADTGGQVSSTKRLGEAMERAAASEDIYYVLTYQPVEGPDRRRELRIEMRSPDLKAVYSRKLVLGDLFPLKVRGLEWRDGILKVSLADFQRTYGDAGLRGQLRIAIRAEAQGREPLTSSSEIHPAEAAVDVELALKFPASGRYVVKVEVEDRLTKRRAQAQKEIEVLTQAPPSPALQALPPAPPISAELAGVLDLAADYCRRLKEGAFRFYCLEDVKERYLERNPVKQIVQTTERSWQYDYQITGAGGEINERRRLIRDGARKVDKEVSKLETRFASRYSVFLPVTLLAVENRPTYSYRLLGRDRVKRRRCTIVEVLPRLAGGGGIAQGKVWIDEEDGSVLKIEINPSGVAGVEELEKAAQNLLARLLLEVTHLYLVEHEGLRFPSMTMFREAYVFEKTVTTQKAEIPFASGEGKKPASASTIVEIPKVEQARREVEFYRLHQDYGKYRFFEVQSREKIKDPSSS
ncbi:MAG: hypothetical protein JXO51_06595 [Candidatus Aminicenantes bacterium]|nr:hypothetical protein [Candidatus Aminicenantes bacterium]